MAAIKSLHLMPSSTHSKDHRVKKMSTPESAALISDMPSPAQLWGDSTNALLGRWEEKEVSSQNLSDRGQEGQAVPAPGSRAASHSSGKLIPSQRGKRSLVQ